MVTFKKKNGGFKQTKVCVSVKELMNKKIVQLIKKYKSKSDIIEVWIDGVRDLELNKIVEQSKDLLLVCKGKDENGSYNGSDDEKINLLQQGIDLGVKYVDVSIFTKSSCIKKLLLHKKKSKVILSFHDFCYTPTLQKLKVQVDRMRKFNSDIIKIAVYPQSTKDIITIFALAQYLRSIKQEFILIGMGDRGQCTRIFAPLIGSSFVFVSPSQGKETASGQMTQGEICDIWRTLQ